MAAAAAGMAEDHLLVQVHLVAVARDMFIPRLQRPTIPLAVCLHPHTIWTTPRPLLVTWHSPTPLTTALPRQGTKATATPVSLPEVMARVLSRLLLTRNRLSPSRIPLIISATAIRHTSTLLSLAQLRSTISLPAMPPRVLPTTIPKGF